MQLNETYCCIPRLVVWKFVGLCDFCTVHHACYANKNKGASNLKGLAKAAKRLGRKAEISDAFLTRCQVCMQISSCFAVFDHKLLMLLY